LDGRRFLLTPSPDGLHRLAAATDARRGEWRGRLDGWSTGELAEFVTALTRLNTDLERRRPTSHNPRTRTRRPHPHAPRPTGHRPTGHLSLE